MSERFIDPVAMQARSLAVIELLKDTAENRLRTYPADIEAVLVFSGPGTYFDRLKPEEPEWMRWMDRDRIRAGVAVVREITATKLFQHTNWPLRSFQLTREDLLTDGPLFIYNGIEQENEIFSRALESPSCLLAKEKVILLSSVIDNNGDPRSINHTGDQVLSLYQARLNPNSLLYGISTVALVAHIPDYVRILNYTKYYDEQSIQRGYPSLHFHCYGLRSRPGTEEPHIASELPRLVQYARQDHLATNQSPFSV